MRTDMLEEARTIIKMAEYWDRDDSDGRLDWEERVNEFLDDIREELAFIEQKTLEAECHSGSANMARSGHGDTSGPQNR